MNWIVLSYSLPSKAGSSPRVTLWRRLRRLGAVMLAGGVYLLPDREECLEAFQWLAQEIQQARGEAALLHVTQIDGYSDQHLVALFQSARAEEYGELDEQVKLVEQRFARRAAAEERAGLTEALEKLWRRYNEIARLDYFTSPAGARIAARLEALSRALVPTPAPPTDASPELLAQYRHVTWVTRPRPHVDRLACAWLIRRFINPDASIRYADAAQPGEVAFDMVGAQFGHHGASCSFETMLQAFGLSEPALRAMAEIVHEIDLCDGLYVRPETAGIAAVLQGWLSDYLLDEERERRGIALFDGLYARFAAKTHES